MNQNKTDDFYNNFYSQGGWKYSSWREKRFLVKRIIRPLNLSRGSRLLEIGCGMGFHSNLFSQLGFEVVGVDGSGTGITYAKKHFPKPRFLHLDAKNLSLEFAPETFDIIFARGMSWYHYELGGINMHGIDVPSRTRGLFQLLKKKGIFILQIKTDFSGSRAENKVHDNQLQDYLGLFRQFGEVIFISDWKGSILKNECDAKRSKNHIIIATRKLTS